MNSIQSSGGAAASKGKRVLVADPNGACLMIMHALLDRDNYSVETTTSGASAMELLARESFDAVFLNRYMGDVDTNEIFSLYQFGSVKPAPVFYMTSDESPGVEQKIKAMGVAGVLFTPVTLEAVRQALACLPSEPDDARPRVALSIISNPAPRPGDGQSLESTRPVPHAVPISYIDPSALSSIEAGASPGFMESFINQSIQDIERNIEVLIKNIQDGNVVRTEQVAHALVGVAGGVGATRLLTLLSTLLSAQGREVKAGAAQWTRDLRSASQGTIEALRKRQE